MSFSDSLEHKASGRYIIRVILDETDDLQTHFEARLVRNEAKPVKQGSSVANSRGPRWTTVA
jgi:hypothetical protein